MFLKCYVFSHTHFTTLASTELLLQYQAAARRSPPLLHTCWTYPASVVSQTSPSVGTHTPITCLGCATPAAPPPPATHRNVRRSPAIPNALSRLHCPPRSLEHSNVFFYAGRKPPSSGHWYYADFRLNLKPRQTESFLSTSDSGLNQHWHQVDCRFLLPGIASASTPDLSDPLDPIQHAASRAGCIGASSSHVSNSYR